MFTQHDRFTSQDSKIWIIGDCSAFCIYLSQFSLLEMLNRSAERCMISRANFQDWENSALTQGLFHFKSCRTLGSLAHSCPQPIFLAKPSIFSDSSSGHIREDISSLATSKELLYSPKPAAYFDPSLPTHATEFIIDATLIRVVVLSYSVFLLSSFLWLARPQTLSICRGCVVFLHCLNAQPAIGIRDWPLVRYGFERMRRRRLY